MRGRDGEAREGGHGWVDKKRKGRTQVGKVEEEEKGGME